VDVLSERLRQVEKQRLQGRRARERAALPQVALVGYTNAGKSTLFNALTRASVYVADQLFATLDPTVRRLDRFSFGAITLADTVGFVRNLPHELVAAFRSTLTEAREADVLLHVVDAADSQANERITEVNAVLHDIGAGEIPQLRVYNKCDLLPEWPAFDGDERVYVSARTGQGIDSLRQAIETRLGGTEIDQELTIPFAAAALRARLLHLGVADDRHYDPAQGYRMHVRMPRTLAAQLAALPGVSGQLVRRELLSQHEAESASDLPAA
jgi:GTPase